jgi:hypothetical protein
VLECRYSSRFRVVAVRSVCDPAVVLFEGFLRVRLRSASTKKN